jgi:hypothetical protein
MITEINNCHNNVSTWAKVRHGVPQGSVLGPLLFLIYVNNLPKIMNNDSIIILFADDTSILVKNPNPIAFVNDINAVFKHINEWFMANLLSLNFDKTNFTHFTSKRKPKVDINITYNNMQINTTNNNKFLGIFINDTLSWETHIEYFIPKLSTACYAIRIMKSYMSQNILRTIYFSYFHSVMNYRLLFWGNSSYSTKVFRLQKCIIRIVFGCKSRDSCRQLFKKIQILPLPSEYIRTLLLSVVQNRNQFKTNVDVHDINTRQHFDFHQHLSSLAKYQKGVYYNGIKVFNSLPLYIKDKADDYRDFKLTLKHFLHKNSFCSLQEYLLYNKNRVHFRHYLKN